MITPRATRLVRVADLQQFKDAIAARIAGTNPLAARDQLVVVPTHAAAAHLRRAIEDRMFRGGLHGGKTKAIVIPDLVTRDELTLRLAERLGDRPRMLNAFEREVLLADASRRAAAAGALPPFRLRPGLIAEMLDFYDALRRHGNDVDAFERLTLDTLEPTAGFDRGAERLVRQTRFLAAAFRQFEARCEATGALDEHGLRAVLLNHASPRPWRHVIVAVRDVAATPRGLWSSDFDMLARIPGLERLEIVVTDTALAGGLHERIDRELPGIEEIREGGRGKGEAEGAKAVGATAEARRQAQEVGQPVLRVVQGVTVRVARDREEEVTQFARRVRHGAKQANAPALDRVALVVRRPLPYVYLARDVLSSARVSCQMFDALPLAGEPFAAAIDLVFTFVTSNFARVPAVALLRSPHFHVTASGVSPRDIAAFDRQASEAGYLGGIDALELLADARQNGTGSRSNSPGAGSRGAARAAGLALQCARELQALTTPQTAAAHLDLLVAFLTAHAAAPADDAMLRPRQLRARAAIMSALRSLRDAYAAHDVSPQDFEGVASVVRRWIDAQTFSPRTGDTGVHVVDADSAAFGDFDSAQLAGLVDGEWPQRARRSIFYSSSLLQQLRWPAEAARVEGERALFQDLLRLPARDVAVSAFLLEDDALVSRSSFADAIDGMALDRVEESVPVARMTTEDALTTAPLHMDVLSAPAARWAALRDTSARGRARQQGSTARLKPRPYSLSALERYQDCPFKFFAADVLGLDEPPDDQTTLSPRVRGRFVHEVFQRFFAAWDRQGGGTITPGRLERARAIFVDVAESLLARLPDVEAPLERARLFGSPVAPGVIDLVLGVEAARADAVVERWLEFRLEGEFTLGSRDGRRAQLRGVADRVDLLDGRRLRVIDYKTGSPPAVKRALQVPVYALCAAERLEQRDGAPWHVDEAAYIAFSGKRTVVPVIKAGSVDAPSVLDAARDRAFAALDGIERGEFPPRPHDPIICNWCAFSAVCRKDYVGDE